MHRLRLHLRPRVRRLPGGIDPGVAFTDLPEDWACPRCRAAKSRFIEI